MMKDRNLEAIILASDVNRNYISGFTGDESYSIITEHKAYFLTDFRYVEQANSEVMFQQIIRCETPVTEFLYNFINDLKLKNLGFEEQFITFELYNLLADNLNCKLLPLDGIMSELRVVKDDLEVKYISRAAEIADLAFEHILSFIKPGVTEREIAIELEYKMKKLGASKLSFNTIVASGKRSSLPHGVATDKLIQTGEFVTLDFGCVYNGYCSDMTRTVVVGRPSEKMKTIYDVVLEAQVEALSKIKAGTSSFEIDKVARNIISQKGYGEYFGHGTGHGVGLEIHEMPRLSPKTNTILKSGMIVTDEPGIYIPDLGGVRIEDLVLVTEEGYKTLSNSPKELICL